MNSTREKLTFWSLLVINPILLLLFTDVSFTKDNKTMPVAQLQTNLVPANTQRGPASIGSRLNTERQYHPETSSWSSPMAFEYEKPLAADSALELDQSVDTEKK